MPSYPDTHDVAPLMKLMDYTANWERYERRRKMLKDLPPVDCDAIRAEAITLLEPWEDISEVVETLIRKRQIQHLVAKGWKF